jgi:hypothetical protein
MKVVGKVVNKSLNAEGHSSVTLQATVDASATGDAIGKLPAATITISSMSAELLDNFKVGESRTFTL